MVLESKMDRLKLEKFSWKLEGQMKKIFIILFLIFILFLFFDVVYAKKVATFPGTVFLQQHTHLLNKICALLESSYYHKDKSFPS